jgi:hypothetical protein
MSSVRSSDGTKIAYDAIGSGPPVILVAVRLATGPGPNPVGSRTCSP